VPPDHARDFFAGHLAWMEDTVGRAWRPLADTAVAASLLFTASDEWSSWRRSVDYYYEGELLWLEVDVLLRQRSKGTRSLDDLCRAFFGARPGARVSTYKLEELVAALNALVPHDWRGLFRDRVERPTARAPRGGVEGAGWRLVYGEKPGKRESSLEREWKLVLAADHSLGLLLKDDGSVLDVRPGSPARRAGLAPGMKLLGVAGRRWSTTALKDALQATTRGARGIELLVEDLDHYRRHRVDYRGGEQHARLEPVKGRADLLGAILAPRAR